MHRKTKKTYCEEEMKLIFFSSAQRKCMKLIVDVPAVVYFIYFGRRFCYLLSTADSPRMECDRECDQSENERKSEIAIEQDRKREEGEGEREREIERETE